MESIAPPPTRELRGLALYRDHHDEIERILPHTYSVPSCTGSTSYVVRLDRGSVFPVAFGDQGDELGEMCTSCLDYLNRRKVDADDPTLGNWPARDWPALEDLQEARRRYPEAMYASRDEVKALSWEAEEDALAASVVWGMKREGELEKADGA